MRLLFLKALLPTGSLLLLLSGCFGPAIRNVEDSSKPISRPLYSVLPPAGERWMYMQGDLQDGGHAIMFFKRVSPTHSLAANIIEVKAGPRPSTAQKFLEMVQNEESKDDPSGSERFKDRSYSFVLDNRFGPYTVRVSFQVKDYGAQNRGNSPFLVLAGYRYYCFHPLEPFVLLTMDYSERGRDGEMNKNLEREAEEFFEHISLVK